MVIVVADDVESPIRICLFPPAELADDEDAYSFKIVFHGPGDRSFILCAESQEAMEEWMKALACASYDYMKLMVAELQKQVDELMGMNSAHPPLQQFHTFYAHSCRDGEAEGFIVHMQGSEPCKPSGSASPPEAQSFQRV